MMRLLHLDYLLPKPPAPPALHTTSLLLTTCGVMLLKNGFLLLAALAPAEAFNIIVLLRRQNTKVTSKW
jgi:hypothetical protein